MSIGLGIGLNINNELSNSIPINGLLAHYDMADRSLGNMAVADLSGNNRTLTLDATFPPSRTSDALVFDGINDLARLPVNGLISNLDNFTIIVIVNGLTQAGASRIYIELAGQSMTMIGTIGSAPDKFNMFHRDNNNVQSNLTGANPFWTGVNRFGAAVKQGGITRLYTNGIVSDTSVWSGGVQNVTQVQMGEETSGGNAFKGNVYRLLKYSVALTDADIKTIYSYFKGLYASRGIVIV